MFQWKLLLVLMFSTFVMSYTGYSQILYMYTPDHWCRIPENYSEIYQISNNQTNIDDIMIPIDEDTMKRSQCFMYDPNSIDEISGNRSNWSQIKCIHGWNYNLTGLFISITTQVLIILIFGRNLSIESSKE